MSALHVVPKENLSSSRSYTLGADPEFFITSENRLLPAFDFLPDKHSSKDKIYWDGFQAEFSMYYTSGCIGLHGCEVHGRLRSLLDKARKIDEKAKISIVNVVRIPDAVLKSADDMHVALGCKPSENIYGTKATPVANGRLLKYRFAGGHMHFGGWHSKKVRAVAKYIKTLDKVLGIWSVGAAQNIDDPIRRQYYGLAGEFRHTFYPIEYDAKVFKGVISEEVFHKHNDVAGFEYRPLSNFYYCHPAIQQLTWQIARNSIVLANEGFHDMWAADEDEVIETINTCNVKRAKLILQRNVHLFNWMFKSNGWSEEMADQAYRVALNGVEAVVKQPDNIADNWNLRDPEGGEYARFISNLTWSAHVRTNK